MSPLRTIPHRAHAALITVAWAALDLRSPSRRSGRRHPSDDRGDVPGWVMITMMTAIVVIVLLGVFQEAVVTAVKNAFDSISGQGGTSAGTTP